MTRVVQLRNGTFRCVALVDEPHLRLLRGVASVYELAYEAAAKKSSLLALVHKHVTDERLDYDSIHAGNSQWRLLPPINHPAEAARCLVSGTGLTHLGSAKNRAAMHTAAAGASETDSMKMFRWGVEGGRPVAGGSPASATAANASSASTRVVPGWEVLAFAMTGLPAAIAA
ncbi:MAG: hypothetical protein ABIZ49_05475, partial [Opitutaceae bacterium]